MDLNYSKLCLLIVSIVSVLIPLTWGRRGHLKRPKHGDVRLIGGRYDYDGTILIYYRRQWGAICDADWDLKDAGVVCEQLGFPGAQKAMRYSHYGRGRRRMWLGGLRCSGYEHKIMYCPSHGWGRHTCRGRYRSAGVICEPRKKTTTTTTTATTTTTTITTTTTTSTKKPTTVVETYTPEVNQTEDNNTQVNETLKITKSDVEQDNKEERPAADQPKKNIEREIRLANGRYVHEGRLEMRRGDGDEWGVICGDHWDLKGAIVVCRQLGLQYGKQGTQGDSFGGENMTKHYASIRCTGREDNINECNFNEYENNVKCSKPEHVAGVICTNSLPDLIPNVKRLENSLRLQDKYLYYLRCSMEEKCLAESAYVVQNTSRNWRTATRRLARFSSVIENRGNADFRPNIDRSQWEWHTCHMHFHSMEVFAHYDIVDMQGNRVAEGLKASFCLEDTSCMYGIEPKYDCSGGRPQGLSVNCSDDYLNDIDCQWIDVTDLKPGRYQFKMEINPLLLVPEQSFENNAIKCLFWYSGFSARFFDCKLDSILY